MGGEPMPMAQETAMPDKSPKIDFATLRARLPKEIGDDIVDISASPGIRGLCNYCNSTGCRSI